MPIATLLHNPKAGEESYTENELITLIEEEGIELIYASVKDENWDKIDPKTNLLIVAGGDGTIRRVTTKLYQDRLNKRFPIALLPAGTANNIAKTLEVPTDDKKAINRWKEKRKKSFDLGKISNLPDYPFFLESFGIVVFPVLMKKMREEPEDLKDTPEKKLNLALQILKDLVKSYQAFYSEIEIDGVKHSGKFLLVEIMNTSYIGPNLKLSPHADPGDGELEAILIPESQRDKLLGYIENKLQGKEEPDFFDTCKAKNVRVKCDNYLAHVDDETFVVNDAEEVIIELEEAAFEFII